VHRHPGEPRHACHDGRIDTARLDVWLWAVRLTPTRSAATELCRAGRVIVNGAPAKPATAVKVGDRIEARIAQRERIVEVRQVLQKRVGAAVAVDCLVDHSPPPPTHVVDPVFQRERGTGRPTKRDRRQMDRMRRDRG
jgi:ribosome-associated heat shock protein Hsp15